MEAGAARGGGGGKSSGPGGRAPRPKGRDPGAWPPAGAASGSGFTETYRPRRRGGAQRLRVGAGERRLFLPAASGGLSLESVVASSRPPGAGPARRMRSRSAAWLLGGTLLLAASASCNYTSRGEKRGGGGSRRREPGRADGASGAGTRRLFCCLQPPPLHLETPLGRFAGESQRPGRLEWAGEPGGNSEGSASLPTGWLLCKHQVAKELSAHPGDFLRAVPGDPWR